MDYVYTLEDGRPYLSPEGVARAQRIIAERRARERLTPTLRDQYLLVLFEAAVRVIHSQGDDDDEGPQAA
jgi:hypothetical protein